MGFCLAAPAPPGRPQERATLEGHLGAIDLAFSPDGKTLASVGGGKQPIRLWDVASGRCTAVLTGHASPPDQNGPKMTAVAFSRDGKTLATSSREEVKLWDLASGKCTATLVYRRSGAFALAFSPDGKTLFAYHGALVLWDLQTRKERAVYLAIRACSPALAFDPKGKALFAGSDLFRSTTGRAPFGLWDAETGKEVFVRDIPHDAIGAVALSRDCKTMAVCGTEKVVQMWDVATGKTLATLTDQPGRMVCLAFSPDGKLLACGFHYIDETGGDVGPPLRMAARLYETRTGRVLATLEGKPGLILGRPLAFSPDGRILATGDRDGKIVLWDLPPSWKAD
jgi:WD40 repeat protein